MTKSSDLLRETGVTPAAFQEIRHTVEQMLGILESADSSPNERTRACNAIRHAFAAHARSIGNRAGLRDEELGECANISFVDFCMSGPGSQEAEFAERLRKLMQARAITQAELAERIGCTQPAISLMVKRQCRPQRSTILKLATALNVDPRELWRDLDVTDILDTVAAAQEEQIMSDTEAEALRGALQRPAATSPAAPLPKRKRKR